jgi:phosphotriesterase-related protein
MSTVETVQGPIDAAEMGVTLIHEHVRFPDEAVAENWPGRYDAQAELDAALRALNADSYDFLPHYFENRDADAIAEHFVDDIEEGTQGTELKAAFLKCAADAAGVTENVDVRNPARWLGR